MLSECTRLIHNKSLGGIKGDEEFGFVDGERAFAERENLHDAKVS